jgi:hypothetical protein
MRLVYSTAVAFTAAIIATSAVGAQQAEAPDRKVAGGGITAPGWEGKVDAAAAKTGGSIKDSMFMAMGDMLHMTIGPAASYWNPKYTAAGNFTAKATFTEAKQVNDHPHPFGIFIGGSKLGTPDAALMYCVAYRDGSFLVRRFNGEVATTVTRKTPHASVKKAATPAESVTQEVGWVVTPDKVSCVINGAEVISYPKSEVVGPGKLASTDGIVGLRTAHNLDLVVTGFAITKQ